MAVDWHSRATVFVDKPAVRRLRPRRYPWCHRASTLDWVDWFNHRRLLEPIGYVPPAEYEARYYEQAAVA